MSNITVEKIQGRKVALLKELEILKNNIHAFQGAIQDCDYWLSEFSKESAEIVEDGEGM